MQKITLKDDCFRVKGYIEIDDNGKKTLKDDCFRVKGYYYPNDNTTRDFYNRIVGYGDILTSLL